MKQEEQGDLFNNISGEVIKLCQTLGLKQPEIIDNHLRYLWLPLAREIVKTKEALGRPLIQGILGGQGTGKTTLASVIRLILTHLGYSTLNISIDDLYLTYQERQNLQKIDPRLIWRGPPGTHDVKLGIEVLDQLRQSQPDQVIEIPRFDKSLYVGAGDRIEPVQVNNIDIVLFEAWFVGVNPVDKQVFIDPPHPIITQEDKKFALDMNERLKDYLPLWERLDRLLVLYPVDYRLSKQWRLEAEQKMIASGKSGMSDSEVEQFVDYFWKALHPELFITPLVNNSQLVDLVIEIQADHTPGAIYKPS